MVRWWLWYLLTAVAVVAGGPALPPSAATALYTLVGLSVVAAIVTGIRRHRPVRPAAWWTLLAGLSCAAVANLGWAALQLLGVVVPPFSVLDVLYYAMYPLIAAALAVLPVHGRYGSPLAGMTEAGIITCTAAVLWWTMLVDPLVIDPGRLPADPDFLAYPLLDLLLGAMAVRLALVSGARAVSFVLVLLSAAALLTADTVYFMHAATTGSVDNPPLSTAGWLLANALLGAAALHPSMARVAPDGTAGAQTERIVALPLYVVMVVLTPVVAGIMLVHEIRAGGIDEWDVLVPLAATTLTAVLLVQRLRQLHRVAQRRAADLDARGGELEAALHSQGELQRELRHRASHDPLTGLPNRLLWHERVAAALAGRADGALFVVDLDGFKDVNDRFGHAMGDDLLLAVAARLRGLMGGTGLLARPGGDEFAVLVEQGGPEAAIRCAQHILRAMRRPVEVQGHELFATVSIGLRVLDPELTALDMLRDADLALHGAKAAGKDQLVLYDRRLREERLQRTRTVERLRGALADSELLLHYQPLVRLADERFVAVEALIRWQPPGERLVPPDAFIPAAEDSGLIVGIGAWVLRQACADAAPWHQRHGTLLSVNVSPRQLREPDFAAMVRDALAASGLPPQALILEITENVLVDAGAPTELALGHLNALRLAGVRVAVDDFGTGYSSLAYLRDLPIDHVKIDRSFMPDRATGDPRLPLVKAVIDLANGLELGTIAEGVETAEQAVLLRGLGCERAQGWHYARPAPAAEVARLLAAGRRAPVATA
ncbi:putative bifunctional diguanylate cyclase/phosphodiesterase [Spirilliplanes yamanashiensis]|uniref:Diguanylate cyclase/phosphodiesterase n=1 Tax=Spirilliplanes yamanashiensis TaxID=42233 RepID=A0A8J3YAR3_9ACTN|nr:bifunctional diguanylate cyclase/phosphodiesterase [Spirilliplanes yamanashiensis]MDP9817740.1 diguanylate cyclase (GGDEF)-like protein [Spirilliplanes yamanashiensis]GIJ04550.1 hypothetical protein Sya03_39020 [Spirilliplanes yamanashiensis]